MIALHLPASSTLEPYIRYQAGCPLTYAQTGATRTDEPVPGWSNDFTRVAVGQGPEDFVRAKCAIAEWRMFPSPWTRILPECPPVRVGTVVAMYARLFGLWWPNACRIVYVLDEPLRYGFAYGTLPGHLARGEELFAVEMAPDGTVWYMIRAFSRPRHWLLWLGYPMLRRLQGRFRRDSARQMQAFVRQNPAP